WQGDSNRETGLGPNVRPLDASDIASSATSANPGSPSQNLLEEPFASTRQPIGEPGAARRFADGVGSRSRARPPRASPPLAPPRILGEVELDRARHRGAGA